MRDRKKIEFLHKNSKKDNFENLSMVNEIKQNLKKVVSCRFFCRTRLVFLVATNSWFIYDPKGTESII